MASSGWQGRQDLYTVNAWLKYRGDINIQGMTRSGTSLRVWGQLALCCVAGSSGGGGSQTVNYGIQAAVNGSGGKVKTSTSASSYAKTFNEGTNYVIGFDTTFTNVSESASTYTVTAEYKSCYNDSCSSTYWSKSLNWTLTLPTNPTGLGVDSITSGWDTNNNRATISARAYLSSYGSGGTMKSLSLLALTQSYVAGLPHRWSNTTSGTTSFNTTLSNGSSCADAGCIDIKGASDYYLGVFADNGTSQSRYAYPNKVYTQPSPLASLTYSQSQGATNVTVSFTATGGSSSLNGSNNVTTQYRYSTNGGSSYTSWASISGTATAWTAKSGSFTCDYGASVVIQARQVYQSQYSATKQVSFTATTGTAPSGGSVSITGSTWNTVSLSASGVNYGYPSSKSGRKISIGVSSIPNNLSYKRENQVLEVTSATTTVDNNSVYPGANALTLKGMLAVYPYLWVWNTSLSSLVAYGSTAHYLPPAPGVLTYTAPAAGSTTATVNYTGVASNNITDYVAADLKRTVRYSVDGGAWVYEVNDVATAVDANTNFTISIPASKSAVVEAWMSYKGKENSHSSTTIVNGNAPVHLYGSVNGVAEEIVHLYGSVNGARKKLTKLYGSQNGICKKIFEDLS